LALKIKGPQSFETSVEVHQSTLRHISEDLTLQQATVRTRIQWLRTTWQSA